MYESLNDVNLVSTLASSMKLPFLCNAVFGSSFNVNLRGNTKLFLMVEFLLMSS